MDYKKYSLENLENWMHDAMSAGEASPQEIYDVIVGVVKENYYIYKQQASQAYELLALLNSNGESITKEHYDGWDKGTTSNLMCDKDDPSPECQKSWNNFWEDNMPPWGHSDLEGLSDYFPHPDQPVYTEEELNAMCDKATSDEEKEKCREYNLREAEYYDKRAKLDAEYTKAKIEANSPYDDGWTMTADGFWIKEPQKDKIVKWRLPVQQGSVDGVDDYYIEFPDDLLEAANLKEGDQVEWVNNNNGTYTLRKITKSLRMDEC